MRFELGLPEPPEGSFASLTHARLRARQGDYRGAVRLLREILKRDPQHVDAQQLLLRIARQPDTTAPPVGDERATCPPTPADPERLVGRLKRWLHKIQRDA